MKFKSLQQVSEREIGYDEIVKEVVQKDPTEFIQASERLWKDPDMLKFVKEQCELRKEQGTKITNLMKMIDENLKKLNEIEEYENQ